MRMFYLWRVVDETGISGTGFVAEGVQFTDGTCALRWLTKHSSTCTYANLDDMKAIHGHGGKTRVLWDDWDFVYVPTGEGVIFTGSHVSKPTSNGDELFDGWPSPAKDYMRISRWMREHPPTHSLSADAGGKGE